MENGYLGDLGVDWSKESMGLVEIECIRMCSDWIELPQDGRFVYFFILQSFFGFRKRKEILINFWTAELSRS
jgi:hypothetical protein